MSKKGGRGKKYLYSVLMQESTIPASMKRVVCTVIGHTIPAAECFAEL